MRVSAISITLLLCFMGLTRGQDEDLIADPVEDPGLGLDVLGDSDFQDFHVQQFQDSGAPAEGNLRDVDPPEPNVPESGNEEFEDIEDYPLGVGALPPIDMLTDEELAWDNPQEGMNEKVADENVVNENVVDDGAGDDGQGIPKPISDHPIHDWQAGEADTPTNEEEDGAQNVDTLSTHEEEDSYPPLLTTENPINDWASTGSGESLKVAPDFSHEFELSTAAVFINVLSAATKKTMNHNLLVQCSNSQTATGLVEVFPLTDFEGEKCDLAVSETPSIDNGGAEINIVANPISGKKRADCSANYTVTLPTRLAAGPSIIDVTAIGAKAASITLSPTCKSLMQEPLLSRFSVQVGSNGTSDCDECEVRALVEGVRPTLVAMGGGSRGIASVETPRFYAALPTLQLYQVVDESGLTDEEAGSVGESELAVPIPPNDEPSMTAILSQPGSDIRIKLPTGTTVHDLVTNDDFPNVGLIVGEGVSTGGSNDSHFRAQIDFAKNAKSATSAVVRVSDFETKHVKVEGGGAEGHKPLGFAILTAFACLAIMGF
eukprot:Selendium_serpulae@DN4966_c0_g1_i1.p1